MKMDWKAAMLAAAMMVGGSTVASAQDAGNYSASPVSYSAIASDGEYATDLAYTDAYGSCGTCADYCGHGVPWTLFGENCYGMKIGGWISAGYYGNFRGVDTNNGNGPVAFRNISNAPTVDQAWLFVEREADAETYCFDLGYRADFLWGADGPDTQAFGYGNRHRWDNRWDSAVTDAGEELYGSAIPQLYMTAAWGDWNVKLGRFFTIMGYETVPAPQNFFYSHAYTMNYGEPFTHTGALAEYNGFDRTTIWGGYTNGWDTAFDNWEGQGTFLGGISYDLTDRTTATWTVNAGDWGRIRVADGPGGVVDKGDIYMNSFVLTHDIGCGWSYVFQHDLGVQSDIAGGDNHWYGINQYLFKEINACWSVGTRLEWFADEDGARVAGVAGNYYAASFGANWKPNSNVIVRPEVRFDKFDDRDGSGGTPFAEGEHDDCVFYGFDAIFTF